MTGKEIHGHQVCQYVEVRVNLARLFRISVNYILFIWFFSVFIRNILIAIFRGMIRSFLFNLDMVILKA
jgi:hypothetical protein